MVTLEQTPAMLLQQVLLHILRPQLYWLLTFSGVVPQQSVTKTVEA